MANVIGLVGPGLIGKTLLAQIAKQGPTLSAAYGLNLQVWGITNSRKMLLTKAPIDVDTWEDVYSRDGVEANLAGFSEHMEGLDDKQRVIIDCTAGTDVPGFYSRWMAAGIHVITPNKRLGSGPLSNFRAVQDLQRQGTSRFFGEATVGAGLPIMSTLQSLLLTGDTIQRIEGVFSGTLSFIFNNFGADRPFSAVVGEAKALGYTEPDPRDDLSGTDVARKVVILARECGAGLELGDVLVQSLVPEPLQTAANAEDFLAGLPQFDEGMARRAREADESGQALRYVGCYNASDGKCSVAFKAYPKRHPFCQLSGSDNIVSFTTERYAKQPLIVRGPGAGAEVTAAGVFGDLLQLARCLGAKV